MLFLVGIARISSVNNVTDENSYVVVVTGIGGGIGQAILLNYLKIMDMKNDENGLKPSLLITASRSTKQLSPESIDPNSNLNVAKLMETPNWYHFQLDLTTEKGVQELENQIKKITTKVDCVINTIGGSLFSHPMVEFPLSEYRKILDLNLTSAFLITQMAKRLIGKKGNILHFVSSSAKCHSANKAPYGMAKAALARLIQYTAVEFGPDEVHINGISPTYIFTPRHEESITKTIQKTHQPREVIIQQLVAGQSIHKPMYSKDLIPMTNLLATTEVITGQIVNVTYGEVINY